MRWRLSGDYAHSTRTTMKTTPTGKAKPAGHLIHVHEEFITLDGIQIKEEM
jgi:hypothetical protein